MRNSGSPSHFHSLYDALRAPVQAFDQLVLREDRDAQGVHDAHPGRRGEAEAEADDTSAVAVDDRGEPRTRVGLFAQRVDDEDVQVRMVDLPLIVGVLSFADRARLREKRRRASWNCELTVRDLVLADPADQPADEVLAEKAPAAAFLGNRRQGAAGGVLGDLVAGKFERVGVGRRRRTKRTVSSMIFSTLVYPVRIAGGTMALETMQGQQTRMSCPDA